MDWSEYWWAIGLQHLKTKKTPMLFSALKVFRSLFFCVCLWKKLEGRSRMHETQNLHGRLIWQGQQDGIPHDLWIHSSTNFHQNYTKVRNYTCTWFGLCEFSKRDKIVIISWVTCRFCLPYRSPNLFGFIKLLNLSMEILWHMINNNLSCWQSGHARKYKKLSKISSLCLL